MKVSVTLVDRVVFWLLLIELSAISYWPHAGMPVPAWSEMLNSAISYLNVGLSGCYGVFSLVTKRVRLNRLVLAPVLILVTLSFVSIVWSTAPYVTLRLSIKLLALLLATLALTRNKSFFLRELTYFISFFIAINLAATAAIYEQTIETGIASRYGAWRGLLPYKTQFGLTSALFLCFLLGHVLLPASRQKVLIALACPLLAIFIIASQSRLAWAAASLGCVSVFAAYFLVQFRTHFRLFGVTLGVASIAALSLFLTPLLEILSVSVGRDLTFSGRGGLWTYFMEAVNQAPVTGYGTGAFMSDHANLEQARYNMGWDDFSSAHSSFIEWGLSLGYPGMGLFGVIFFCFAFVALRDLLLRRQVESLPAIGMLPALLITAAFTSTAGFASLPWFLGLSILSVSRRAKQTAPYKIHDRHHAARPRYAGSDRMRAR